MGGAGGPGAAFAATAAAETATTARVWVSERHVQHTQSDIQRAPLGGERCIVSRLRETTRDTRRRGRGEGGGVVIQLMHALAVRNARDMRTSL